MRERNVTGSVTARWLPLIVLFTGSACTGLSASRRAELDAEAQPALVALQASRFDEARALAQAQLDREPRSARAAAIAALARYPQLATDFYREASEIGSTALLALLGGTPMDRPRINAMVSLADGRLKEVDALLAAAQTDEAFSLELCPACWEVDWNASGAIDANDRKLLEVEVDAEGKAYPEGDPRRRPTFRFDAADLSWLRAMVHFQRAAIGVLPFINLSAVVKAFQGNTTESWAPLEARLAIRALLLSGLAHAQRCREQVRAETDDEREWVPHPGQRSHALPLEMSPALFETWGGVLDDLKALVLGEQGLDIAQLNAVARRPLIPELSAYFDLGALLTQLPTYRYTEEDRRLLEEGADLEAIEALSKRARGPAFKDKMTPSPLVGRLQRARAEVDRGADTAFRKLTYLLWLN